MKQDHKVIAILCSSVSTKTLLSSRLVKLLSGRIKSVRSEILESNNDDSEIILLSKNTWLKQVLENKSSIQFPTHIFYIKPEGNISDIKKALNLFDTSAKESLESDPKKLAKIAHFISTKLKYQAIFRTFDLSAITIDDIAYNIEYLIEKDVALLSPREITLSSTMKKGDLFLLSKENFSAQGLITSDHYILKPDLNKQPDITSSEIEKHACHFNNIGKVFSLNQFNEPRHPPVSLGLLNNRSNLDRPFDAQIIQIQNMPIAFPSTKALHNYRIPTACSRLNEFIQRVINFWHKFEPNAHEYFAYLSVSQGPVPPWKAQRIPGIHCEGFQYYRPYQICEYTFTCLNSLPTAYYIQSFDTNKIDPQQSFFTQFAKLAHAHPQESQAPYEISMMDPYCFHSSVINTSDATIYRTFARIIYSTIKYDRNYNTHNPAFEYSWNRQPVKDPY